MVSRTPLVLVSGGVTELPAGDTLAGAGGTAPTGSMAQFPAGVSPSGWLSCDATSAMGANVINVSRSTYSALFAVIGTTYGQGDGSTTFGLPTVVESDGVWSPTTSYPSANNIFTLTPLADGRILAIGGQGAVRDTYFGTVSGSVITWAAGTALVSMTYQHATALLPDGRVLIVGNMGDGGSATLFGTISGNTITWAAGTSMPVAVRSTTLTVLGDGRVLTVCGYNPSPANTYSSATYFGTVSGNTITWVSGTAFPKVLALHTTTLVGTNKILVLGGTDGTTQNVTPYFGAISTNTITWTALSDLHRGGIQAHCASLLPDGRLLVVGGFVGTLATARATLYSIENNLFERDTAHLPMSNAAAAMAVLTDGRVLHCAGKVTSATALSYLFSMDRNWIKT